MAENSKRELIILELISNLEDISSINAVERIRPSFADLGNFADTQLPLVAVVGKLPKPVPKRSGRTTGKMDKFISDLEIDLFCYAMDNVNPDSKVSDLADDLWTKIYSDPTLITDDYPKGLTLEVVVMPEIQVGIWDPYVVFKMVCTYKYIHGTGGI